MVNDTFQVTEDTPTTLPNFLSNDTYNSSNVTVTFDALSTNQGTIVKNNNQYTYTSAKSFVGSDTFTYTICSTIQTNNCETATVRINVTDQGNPSVTNDSYTTPKNSVITISDFLSNDTLIDDAKIESISNDGTAGTIVLNNDNTITYTPQNNFIGNDTFTYTVCDDDATKSCATGTITIDIKEVIAFNIPSDLVDYYKDIYFTSDKSSNYNVLKQLLTQTHSNQLSYGQRHNYLYNADEDISNTANVILMYSGESRDEREYSSSTNSHSTQTFNTEHVYPKSKLTSSTAEADLHHLRSCDAGVNSSRSNYSFIDGSGDYKKEGSTWFPGDEWKGDIARMVFYLNARYGETFDKVGTLELF